MTKVTYHIDQHDDGWAYQVNGVYSETFPTHDMARKAAQRAAQEQHVPGEARTISWEDEKGKWHEETARGDDRPDTDEDHAGVGHPAGQRIGVRPHRHRHRRLGFASHRKCHLRRARHRRAHPG